MPSIFGIHAALEDPAGRDAPIVCAVCQETPPLFDRTIACGGYETGLRDLIPLLKFQQVRPAARFLGRMLADQINAAESAMPTGTIAVVPVPLHKRKQAARGFNQSEETVRAALKRVSRQERFELKRGNLLRTRDTGSQIGLTRDQRRDSLRGAFSMKDRAAISGRHVLLVDDVYTTGTTASECARVLRKAGAASVWVAVIARTQRVPDLIFRAGKSEREDALTDSSLPPISKEKENNRPVGVQG
jgi:ComF family protein